MARVPAVSQVVRSPGCEPPESLDERATTAASAKEQFELLYNDLRSLQESFVDGAIKMTGFQVIVLGWLITAESVTTALRGNAATFLATLAAIVVGSSYAIAATVELARATGSNPDVPQ